MQPQIALISSKAVDNDPPLSPLEFIASVERLPPLAVQNAVIRWRLLLFVRFVRRTIHCTLKDWEVVAAICVNFREVVGKEAAKSPPHVWVSLADQQGFYEEEEEEESFRSDGEAEDSYSHGDWSHDAVCVRSRGIYVHVVVKGCCVPSIFDDDYTSSWRSIWGWRP